MDVVLVTGSAGFIGSHLAEHLLSMGKRVIGVDTVNDYYSAEQKERNLAGLVDHPSFSFQRTDLLDADLHSLLRDVDIVLHQAGQPGVRSSWRDGFDDHVSRNVLATQRLLEAAASSARTRKLIYASSSSVYGNSPTYPTVETQVAQPESPYGVTKLAAEHLVSIYGRSDSLECVSLRYFTVFGPRQRPDMAIHRLLLSAATQSEFRLFGDGSFERDFTYVGDVVAANLLAMVEGTPSSAVYNVGGNRPVSMNDLIELVADTVGRRPNIVRASEQAGDVRKTGASSELIARELGWRPEVDLARGVAREWEWLKLSLPG